MCCLGARRRICGYKLLVKWRYGLISAKGEASEGRWVQVIKMSVDVLSTANIIIGGVASVKHWMSWKMWKKRSPAQKPRPVHQRRPSTKLVCPVRINPIKAASKVVAPCFVAGWDGLVRSMSQSVRHWIVVNWCYQIQLVSFMFNSIRSTSFRQDHASGTVRRRFQPSLIQLDVTRVSSIEVWLMWNKSTEKTDHLTDTTNPTFGSLAAPLIERYNHLPTLLLVMESKKHIITLLMLLLRRLMTCRVTRSTWRA